MAKRSSISDSDILRILESINTKQSLDKGCAEVGIKFQSFLAKLQKIGQPLQLTYVLQHLETGISYSVDSPEIDAQLRAFLEALNEAKFVSQAALRFKLVDVQLKQIVREKGFKLLKKWVIVDIY